MALQTWLTFFVASWLISLSPGAGAISCMSIGMRYGYRVGVWNIFGLQLGATLLIVIVAAGLGAALAASVTTFLVIKWFGVGYLIYLGIRQFFARAQPIDVDSDESKGPPPARGQMVLQGILINVSNPKAIVFMLAVLPQFIDPHAPQLPQYATVIATLFCTDAVVMSAYTLLAARVLAGLRQPHHIRWLNRSFGSLFIAAGLLLATFKRGA